MSTRKNISSGAKWEDIIGYSRAVRVGNIIEVSGTTAMKEGVLQGQGDIYVQTKTCIQIIQAALQQAGASIDDVVRTRMYVTDISLWEEVGRAHGEFFSTIKPATSMIEVAALIDADILIEIEATAVVS